MKQEILVKVEHMNKRFGSTVALKDVSIEVCSGRVLGLIGENGSGKSTVTSIIAGMQNADSGTMTYHDKEWKPESMLYSLEHGIGMIVQETGTVPGITVAENIFLGETKFFKSFGEKHKWGPVKRKLLNQKAQEALDAIGASHIRAEQMTASLDLQERKLIEIARIMNKHPEVLVVDETTTALSQKGSIGPIFIATYRAVLGSPIRTEDGNALALSQGYWVATSPEEFSEYYAVDSSVDSPAYTKGMLDGLLTADYASFEKFVSAYGFKDIQKEAK